jgi:ATP/maltotriose-dependent transcriptional regulator MalT
MASPAVRADAQQPAAAGAAYVVDLSLVDVVHAYLTQAGLEVQAVKVTAEQLPRFNVLPAGIRISHLEKARRAKLSDREFEALTLIAEGLSNPEIAARQNVALDTAKTFVRKVFVKLGVRDRAHAVAVGYQRGILGGA